MASPAPGSPPATAATHNKSRTQAPVAPIALRSCRRYAKPVLRRQSESKTLSGSLRFQPKAPLVKRLEFARAELAFVEPRPFLGRKVFPKHAVRLMRIGNLQLEEISGHVGPSPYPSRPGCTRNIPLRVPRAKMQYTPCGCSVPARGCRVRPRRLAVVRVVVGVA